MGWTFSYDNSRSVMITRRTRSTTQADGTRWECLRHTTVGNVLWTVWEVTPDDPIPPRVYRPPYRFIGCDLLAPGGKKMGWGYKDMCESMGPSYFTCPLVYLDMVPVVANAGWREKVREYHATRSRKVGIGDVLVLKDMSIPEARVVAKIRQTLIVEHDGRQYRFPRRLMARVVEHRVAA